MKKLVIVSFCLLFFMAAAEQTIAVVIPEPPQQTFDKTADPCTTIPDLDQNRDYTGDGIAETKWCAPTASADCLWYYGSYSYPLLIPAGANDIDKADTMITSLGGLMGTSDAAGGTTIAGAVAGLQAYYNASYPGVFDVNVYTAWTFPDGTGAPSAKNLWNWMSNNLYDCNDVLPILWLPGGQYGDPPVPPTDDSAIWDTPLDSISGHLVMMTGYDYSPDPNTITVYDPDDDADGAHAFPPGPPAPLPVTSNVNSIGYSPEGTALALGDGSILIVGAIISVAGEAQEAGKDYGDAPEGSAAIAYPSTGQVGNFPTCITVGPIGSYVEHTNFGAYFGALVDFELDGNGGTCPGCFPPYDQDECFDPLGGNNSDPGLMMPTSYTIDASGQVVPCPTCTGTSLGQSCNVAVWGTDVDIWVNNTMPGQTTGYVNVLIDWNQDGQWSGSSSCPGCATVNEHVLQNFPVQNPYNGPLSALGPPNFTIGPNPGYVWARFTITETPVTVPWDGSGSFEDGESEDYLLKIDQTEVKWIQPPDMTTAGMDIRVDRNDGFQRVMADDFECNTPGLITDVHFWGSWKYDDKVSITKIHLSIHSDDPVGPGGTDPDNTYSKPDVLLWEMDFFPSDFNESLYYTLPTQESEWWWDIANQILFPTGDQKIWKYDIYIDPEDAFEQEGTEEEPIIYWLDLYVETNGEPESEAQQFGWKTSCEHWNDDAVFSENDGASWWELRYPGPDHPYEGQSIDMAFIITTSPLPEDYVKWEQPPDKTETGIDIRVDRNDGIPRLLADDFECNRPGWITDVHLWGSWNDDFKTSLQNIHLSIHGDIPAAESPTGYSMPNDPPLWEMDFGPASFKESLFYTLPTQEFEWWMDMYEPALIQFGDQQIWKYDINIPWDVAFYQEGTEENPIVYWLDVYVDVNDSIQTGAQFGWKTSCEHWNDDAVWLNTAGEWIELIYPVPDMFYPGSPEHPYAPNSIDMAFAITTEQPWLYPACWDWPTQCHADSDGDGSVGLLDFYDLRDGWNTTYAANPPANPANPQPGEYHPCIDINRDGAIGLLDFYELRDNWNSTVPADCTPGDINRIYK